MLIKLDYKDSDINISTKQNGDLTIDISDNTANSILPQVMNYLSYFEFIQTIGENEFQAMVNYYITEYKEDLQI